MDASDLRDRVAFRDEEGAILYEKYANVETTGGRQGVSGLAVHGDITHVVTVRVDKSINRTLTVLWDGKELDIDNVIHETKERKWTKITCIEVV